MDVPPFFGGFALANEAPADHLLGREADGGHPTGAAENGADPDAGGVLGITRELGLRESYGKYDSLNPNSRELGLRESYGKYVDSYRLIIRMLLDYWNYALIILLLGGYPPVN